MVVQVAGNVNYLNLPLSTKVSRTLGEAAIETITAPVFFVISGLANNLSLDKICSNVVPVMVSTCVIALVNGIAKNVSIYIQKTYCNWRTNDPEVKVRFFHYLDELSPSIALTFEKIFNGAMFSFLSSVLVMFYPSVIFVPLTLLNVATVFTVFSVPVIVYNGIIILEGFDKINRITREIAQERFISEIRPLYEKLIESKRRLEILNREWNEIVGWDQREISYPSIDGLCQNWRVILGLNNDTHFISTPERIVLDDPLSDFDRLPLIRNSIAEFEHLVRLRAQENDGLKNIFQLFLPNQYAAFREAQRSSEQNVNFVRTVLELLYDYTELDRKYILGHFFPGTPEYRVPVGFINSQYKKNEFELFRHSLSPEFFLAMANWSVAQVISSLDVNYPKFINENVIPQITNLRMQFRAESNSRREIILNYLLNGEEPQDAHLKQIGRELRAFASRNLLQGNVNFFAAIERANTISIPAFNFY
jgi:hypothetical protein